VKTFHAGGTLTLASSRAADFIALGKPELTLLSVLTAVGAAYLGSTPGASHVPIFWTFLGTLLVGLGAGTLNMLLEREYDGRMKRTEHRPLPAGRVSAGEAGVWGVCCSMAGVLLLDTFTNHLAALLAVLTILSYLFLYTPLKRVTPFATVVGGIPGALPPVIGWAAVRGSIGLEGWGLFAILFFWQMPHFLSLSWMYRKDYERAGYRLLAVLDRDGTAVRRQILIHSAALVPASVLPRYVGICGDIYFAGALVLSTGFLLSAIWTAISFSNSSARRLFHLSLAYLPSLIFLMILDRIS
jgi:protoheme IX farnesyltransferase